MEALQNSLHGLLCHIGTANAACGAFAACGCGNTDVVFDCDRQIQPHGDDDNSDQHGGDEQMCSIFKKGEKFFLHGTLRSKKENCFRR